MNFRKVTIIGGGIAGIAAAVFLSEKGYSVRIIENAPVLGGRVSSFLDREENIYLDSGQHIFAGWYTNTFELLKILKKENSLIKQKSLSIRLLSSQNEIYQFKASDVPAPFNILSGFLGYNALSFSGKIKTIRFLSFLKKKKTFKKYHDKNIDYLFKSAKLSDEVIKYFWEPMILAVFNTIPEYVSVENFRKVIQLSLQNRNYTSLVFPDEDLHSLFIKSFLEYADIKKAELYLSKECKEIVISNSEVKRLKLRTGEEISSDYYVSAVPFFRFQNLFNQETFNTYFNNYRELSPSAVISVYLYFDSNLRENIIPFSDDKMLGVISKTIQWIFKIRPDIISITISAADYIQKLTDKSSQEIFDICQKELCQLFNGFEKLKIKKYKVIKSRKATFVPDVKSVSSRIPVQTKIKNLFMVGDWIDTGLPSTIESAVTSAKILSKII